MSGFGGNPNDAAAWAAFSTNPGMHIPPPPPPQNGPPPMFPGGHAPMPGFGMPPGPGYYPMMPGMQPMMGPGMQPMMPMGMHPPPMHPGMQPPPPGMVPIVHHQKGHAQNGGISPAAANPLRPFGPAGTKGPASSQAPVPLVTNNSSGSKVGKSDGNAKGKKAGASQYQSKASGISLAAQEVPEDVSDAGSNDSFVAELDELLNDKDKPDEDEPEAKEDEGVELYDPNAMPDLDDTEEEEEEGDLDENGDYNGNEVHEDDGGDYDENARRYSAHDATTYDEENIDDENVDENADENADENLGSDSAMNNVFGASTPIKEVEEQLEEIRRNETDLYEDLRSGAGESEIEDQTSLGKSGKSSTKGKESSTKGKDSNAKGKGKESQGKESSKSSLENKSSKGKGSSKDGGDKSLSSKDGGKSSTSKDGGKSASKGNKDSSKSRDEKGSRKGEEKGSRKGDRGEEKLTLPLPAISSSSSSSNLLSKLTKGVAGYDESGKKVTANGVNKRTREERDYRDNQESSDNNDWKKDSDWNKDKDWNDDPNNAKRAKKDDSWSSKKDDDWSKNGWSGKKDDWSSKKEDWSKNVDWSKKDDWKSNKNTDSWKNDNWKKNDLDSWKNRPRKEQRDDKGRLLAFHDKIPNLVGKRERIEHRWKKFCDEHAPLDATEMRKRFPKSKNWALPTKQEIALQNYTDPKELFAPPKKGFLICGDGNMGFAASVAEILGDRAKKQLVATVYEPHRAAFCQLYEKQGHELPFLEERGVMLDYGVDATKLHQLKPHLYGKLDHVIWNFAYPFDRNEKIPDFCKNTVLPFFKSAKHLLKKNGSIWFALKIEQFGNWRLELLLLEAGLRLQNMIPFKKEHFRLYGEGSYGDQRLTNEKMAKNTPFVDENCRIFLFTHADSEEFQDELEKLKPKYQDDPFSLVPEIPPNQPCFHWKFPEEFKLMKDLCGMDVEEYTKKRQERNADFTIEMALKYKGGGKGESPDKTSKGGDGKGGGKGDGKGGGKGAKKELPPHKDPKNWFKKWTWNENTGWKEEAKFDKTWNIMWNDSSWKQFDENDEIPDIPIEALGLSATELDIDEPSPVKRRREAQEAQDDYQKLIEKMEGDKKMLEAERRGKGAKGGAKGSKGGKGKLSAKALGKRVRQEAKNEAKKMIREREEREREEALEKAEREDWANWKKDPETGRWVFVKPVRENQNDDENFQNEDEAKDSKPSPSQNEESWGESKDAGEAKNDDSWDDWEQDESGKWVEKSEKKDSSKKDTSWNDGWYQDKDGKWQKEGEGTSSSSWNNGSGWNNNSSGWNNNGGSSSSWNNGWEGSGNDWNSGGNNDAAKNDEESSPKSPSKSGALSASEKEILKLIFENFYGMHAPERATQIPVLVKKADTPIGVWPYYENMWSALHKKYDLPKEQSLHDEMKFLAETMGLPFEPAA